MEFMRRPLGSFLLSTLTSSSSDPSPPSSAQFASRAPLLVQSPSFEFLHLMLVEEGLANLSEELRCGRNRCNCLESQYRCASQKPVHCPKPKQRNAGNTENASPLNTMTHLANPKAAPLLQRPFYQTSSPQNMIASLWSSKSYQASRRPAAAPGSSQRSC
jgi:hypothetical protein